MSESATHFAALSSVLFHCERQLTHTLPWAFHVCLQPPSVSADHRAVTQAIGAGWIRACSQRDVCKAGLCAGESEWVSDI